MTWFKKETRKTYEIEIVCANCCDMEEVEIPKGMKVKAFCKNYICPECGCKTMKKEEDC